MFAKCLNKRLLFLAAAGFHHVAIFAFDAFSEYCLALSILCGSRGSDGNPRPFRWGPVVLARLAAWPPGDPPAAVRFLDRKKRG